MTITLNGKACAIEEGITLAELMTHMTGSTRGSAAIVDGEVVPRGTWSSCVLRAGQAVELITAVQGG
jgi:sulfur carrier protein